MRLSCELISSFLFYHLFKIQGESKFENERNTIKNDGKQNFETYQLITIDEKKRNQRIFASSFSLVVCGNLTLVCLFAVKGGKSQKDLKDSQKLTPKPNEE